MQLGVVWDPLLKADPEGPTLISRTACLHGLSVHVERLSHVRLQHTHHLRAGVPRRFHRDRLHLDPLPPPGPPCAPGNQRLTSTNRLRVLAGRVAPNDGIDLLAVNTAAACAAAAPLPLRPTTLDRRQSAEMRLQG